MMPICSDTIQIILREQVQQMLLNINPQFHVAKRNNIIFALPPEMKPLQKIERFI